jgi:hypothetical protein
MVVESVRCWRGRLCSSRRRFFPRCIRYMILCSDCRLRHPASMRAMHCCRARWHSLATRHRRRSSHASAHRTLSRPTPMSQRRNAKDPSPSHWSSCRCRSLSPIRSPFRCRSLSPIRSPFRCRSLSPIRSPFRCRTRYSLSRPSGQLRHRSSPFRSPGKRSPHRPRAQGVQRSERSACEPLPPSIASASGSVPGTVRKDDAQPSNRSAPAFSRNERAMVAGGQRVVGGDQSGSHARLDVRGHVEPPQRSARGFESWGSVRSRRCRRGSCRTFLVHEARAGSLMSAFLGSPTCRLGGRLLSSRSSAHGSRGSSSPRRDRRR